MRESMALIRLRKSRTSRRMGLGLFRLMSILPILFMAARPCRADPRLILNGGWGVFPNSQNALELSQWFRPPLKSLRFGGGADLWIGVSEGLYLGSGGRTHYFEFQLAASYLPLIGISFGPSFNRREATHYRGSLWASLGLVTLSAGIEQDPGRGEYDPFAGLLLKIPFYTDAKF